MTGEASAGPGLTRLEAAHLTYISPPRLPAATVVHAAAAITFLEPDAEVELRVLIPSAGSLRERLNLWRGFAEDHRYAHVTGGWPTWTGPV